MDGNFTAFYGTTCLSSGPLPELLRAAKAHLDGGGPEPLLVFNEETGQ
ncbi:MAG: hypothetical protein JW751_15370 [Polyangiaceae bacterium]|nr:hypothetical protein [Polyangiaceae bacterium]